MLIRTCTFLALSNHHLFLFMAMDFILFFFYFSMRVTLCNCLQNANKESNKTVTVWHKSSYSKYFKYIFTSRTHFTFYNIWENKFYWFFYIFAVSESKCRVRLASDLKYNSWSLEKDPLLSSKKPLNCWFYDKAFHMFIHLECSKLFVKATTIKKKSVFMLKIWI